LSSGVTCRGRRRLRYDHCPGKTRHALVGVPPTRDAGVASLRAVPSLGRLDRHFTLPSPSTPIQIFHPIRRDVRRGGCDDRCPLRSTANRMRCFCVNITPFFPSGTHARSWARNRGPGRSRSRSRGERLRADVTTDTAMIEQP